MKLRYRLLISHFAVALLSILLVSLMVVSYITTLEFRLAATPNELSENLFDINTHWDEELGRQVLDALLKTVIIGGSLMGIFAAGVSMYINRRIMRPVRAVVDASRHIADGHYSSRVYAETHDELGELAQSFNQMANALEESEITRRQLLTDISHELKTPLAGIKAYMEGLRDGVLQPIPENFQQVYREADRLQRLVQSLQELSLVAENIIDLQLQAVSLENMVNNVTSRLSLQYEAKNIQLITKIPTDLPTVRADCERIEQVLVNLLGNSLQYTDEGGTVTISAHQNGQHVECTVQDTGIGIQADDLARIFQRFYRVDKSRARSSGGSGIGLTIARHLIEAHDGRLWAESPGLNQGSTFCFTLPLA